MKYLEEAEVGDKLWNIGTQCWETITEIVDHPDACYPIITNETAYTLEGYQYHDQYVTIVFWDKVELPELPKRPVRKVKKSGWVNIYSDGDVSGRYYASKEQAYARRLGGSYVATTKIEWEE